ncbi:hypothetical protein lerEdw1_010945 [Lerista edwardsae]|nr:hypothetical protein lerEdw1_010945 [Lerista edwardsae]
MCSGSRVGRFALHCKRSRDLSLSLDYMVGSEKQPSRKTSAANETPDVMEQEKELYLPDPLRSKDAKTFPSAHSEFSKVARKVKKEEDPWAPNHLAEESKTFPGVLSGIPGAMTEVKEEEEPESTPQLKQEERSWVQKQKLLDEKEVPVHKGGLPGVKVEEDESWNEDSKKSEPLQASCSEFPVVAVKVKDEEESGVLDHLGHEEGFPGVIIKVEPEEDPWSLDPQTAMGSTTVSGVQSGEDEFGWLTVRSP